MKYLFFFFSLILLFSSCSKDDDSIDNPLYINGNIDNITFNEDNIIGDSIEITLYYTVENQGYSFYELTYTKLEGQDESLVDNYLIEMKLVNDGKTEETVQNSIVWKFFPTAEGNYGINYINTVGDTIQKQLTAEYNITEHTMINEDYQIIVDSVINNPDLEQYVNVYEEGEVYYGADAYYAIFDIDIQKKLIGDKPNMKVLVKKQR